eukprot:gene8497-35004_t
MKNITTTLLLALTLGSTAAYSTPAPPPILSTDTNFAGINNYYLYSCNSTIRAEALNAVKAAGLKVLRVFLLSTEGAGSEAACASTPTPDVEPVSVGTYDDTILGKLDDLLFEASARGIKVTVALHDRWSLGCWRSDAYQKKYNISVSSNCGKEPESNDPGAFYTHARKDFKARIVHVLQYRSRHTHQPIGHWKEAVFSVEAENEAFGGAKTISASNDDWIVIKQNVDPAVLVTTGGGGIGRGTPGTTGSVEYERVKAMASCAAIDVVALHSYDGPIHIDAKIAAYKSAIATNVAMKHGIPQFFWEMRPSHLPLPSTELAISAPAPAPSPGQQRFRGADGEWVNRCTDTSCPAEAWVTALYPATQAAALQPLPPQSGWPEVWGCSSDSDCRYNGKCVASSSSSSKGGDANNNANSIRKRRAGGVQIRSNAGSCICNRGWRGPTCAALSLTPTPRENGFQHTNSSSWGGTIMRDPTTKEYHMFSSFITENCGLDAWSTNSEIVRATSGTPLGPYVFQEVVADRFAHEPNLVFGTGDDSVLLLASMQPTPPTGFVNCTGQPVSRFDTTKAKLTSAEWQQEPAGHQHRQQRQPPAPTHPQRNTYLWSASSAQGISKAKRELAISAFEWDYDPLHNGAICDTNAAGAINPTAAAGGGGGGGAGKSLVGLWRRCETDHLHTVPHTVAAADAGNASTYAPNISTNMPFMSHAGAEDPMVYTATTDDGQLIFHAILHDEQITRCADAPVGCFPTGRHAFSTDVGRTWDYSAFDAYNGTVEYTDGSVEVYYLRARPHLLVDPKTGEIEALSNGLRPTKASEYVYTLVQPVG